MKAWRAWGQAPASWRCANAEVHSPKGVITARPKMALGERAIGVICIVLVVLLWVGSSELIQLIFDSDKFSFESPLFLTFYSTSLFSVYLSGFLFSKSWRRSISGPVGSISTDVLHDDEIHALLDEVGECNHQNTAEATESQHSSDYACLHLSQSASAYETWKLAGGGHWVTSCTCIVSRARLKPI